MKRFGQALCSILPALVAIALQFVVAIIGEVVYAIVLSTKLAAQGIVDPEQLQERLMDGLLNSGVTIYIMIAVYVIYLIAFGLWYKFGFIKKEKTRWKEVMKPSNIVVMFLIGFAAQFSISMALAIVSPLFPAAFDKYAEMMETLQLGESILPMIPVVILAPIAEEIIFRGMTLKMAKKAMPLLWANVLQAALFGLYHMNIIQGVYTFVLGLVLGYIAIKFDSIYPTIIVHLALNLSACFLDYILPASLDDVGMILIMLAGTAVIVAGLVYTSKHKALKPEEEQVVETVEAEMV